MLSTQLDICGTFWGGLPELATARAAAWLQVFPGLMSFIRLEGVGMLISVSGAQGGAAGQSHSCYSAAWPLSWAGP